MGSQNAAVVLNEQEVVRLSNSGSKAIRKKVLQLAGPSLTEMILINFIQMLNMIMVGRLSAEAVTAVGMTNQPIFFAYAFFIALNVGTTAIVARAIGSGDPAEATQAAQQTFIINILLSIVVMFLGYIFAEPVLKFMGAENEVLREGVPYAKIQFLTLGFSTVAMGLAAVLRGAGDTITPMRINIITNIVLVVVGFPLIYGYFGLPKLGLIGAGIATAIANAVSIFLYIFRTFSHKSVIQLSIKKLFDFDHSLIARILKIGLPSAGEQFAMRGGQMIYSIVVAGLGTITFAANQICFNIWGLTFMPGMAFAIAATTLVGQALGAGDPELAEKFGWEVRKLGMYISGVMGVLFIVFAPYFMMPYTNDSSVVEQGAIALRVLGLIQISQATQFILAGALRGAGDTKYPLYATFIGVWCFRVVICLLLVNVLGWGILGAWIAIAADQIVRSLIIVHRYKSGKWKSIHI